MNWLLSIIAQLRSLLGHSPQRRPAAVEADDALRQLPLSTHVLAAHLLLRAAPSEDAETVLRSLGAQGGNGFWWLFHDDYNKLDLVLNSPPYSQALVLQHDRLGLPWTPSVSGHVYIKGTDVARSSRHLHAFLRAMLASCDGVVSPARSDCSPSSVFVLADLDAGINPSGMTFDAMVR